MSFAAGKLRVLIATTNGPVEVLLLTEEDAAIGRCVACIGGTTETADIAAAYHAFVVRPTGVVETLFGHPCYRLDISGRIDAGSSWQLGVLAAHGLRAAGRLAEENDVADGVLWATGSVRAVDLTVGAVSHVPEKLANSLDRLRQERAAGRHVLVALPAANAAEVPTALASELAALGIELVALARVPTLFGALETKLPDSGPKVPVPAYRPIATVPAPVGAAPTPVVRAAPRRRLVWAAAAASIALLGVALATTLMVRGSAVSSPQQAAAGVSPSILIQSSENISTPSPARLSNRGTDLVPELVPFITVRDRERIRDEYMTAPNYKALAMSLLKASFVTGRPTQEAADKGAMEACETANASGGAAERERACDLYASGTIVVTHRSSPTMPSTPWIRNPSVERPFVAAEFPMSRPEWKDKAKPYRGWPRSKALVIAPTGFWYVTFAQSSPEEAMRRTLERCGYLLGLACMVLAVDDTFVIPVPTLAKAVGFYRPEALFGVRPQTRTDVAWQLANATEGWNAVAVGSLGQVGIKVGAASERGAVDGAMEDCAKHDSNCRIAVIGPFLVETDPVGPPGSPPSPDQAPAAPAQP